jgi:hypothetical protein
MTKEGGRVAIDEALRARYPQGEPVIFGAGVGVLAEVRAYLHAATSEEPEHWHFVTLGLTELDEKTSPDPERSGWGFELTMRVVAPDGARDLPQWPARVLAELAAYVEDSRRVLEGGHQVSLETPVPEAPAIAGLALRRDPELPAIGTPNGGLEFLQVVGVTADEADLLARWSITAFLDVLAQRTPLLVTRPDRPSLLRDPALGPLLEQRATAEGSAQSLILPDTLSWTVSRWPRKGLQVFIGPAVIARRALRPLLATRTARGEQFRAASGGRTLYVSPGDRGEWRATEGSIRLTVSPALSAELDAFLAEDRPTLKSATLPGFVLTLVD